MRGRWRLYIKGVRMLYLLQNKGAVKRSDIRQFGQFIFYKIMVFVQAANIYF